MITFYAQFPEIVDDFPRWRRRPQVAAYLAAFLDAHFRDEGGASKKIESHDDLWKLIERVMVKAETDWFSHVDFQQTERPLSMYFWVSDNKEAVVVFPALGGKDVAYGLRTVDKKLIESLQEMFSAYLKNPNPTKGDTLVPKA